MIKHLHWTVLVGFIGLAAAAPPASAQWAVVDAPAIAQLIQEVQTMQQQLQVAQAQLLEAKQTLQSTTGDRGMGQLLSGTSRNYLPTSWTQLTSASQGGGAYSGLASDVRNAISANAILSPVQLAEFSTSDQQQILAARQAAAMRQALAQEALANTSNRFAAIQTLVAAIGSAADQKAILDLQTRIERGVGHVAKRANQASGPDRGEQGAGIVECSAGTGARDRRAGPIRKSVSARTVAVRRGQIHGIFCRPSGAWLNGQLATYIGNNTARLAAVLEPAMVTLATLYVMVWGYLHLTGQIDEPFVAGLKRIVTLAVVFGVGLRPMALQRVIVDTFYDAPSQLAATVIGAGNPVGTIDAIWESGGTVADNLWIKGRPHERRRRLSGSRAPWCGAWSACCASMRCS